MHSPFPKLCSNHVALPMKAGFRFYTPGLPGKTTSSGVKTASGEEAAQEGRRTGLRATEEKG